MTKSENSQFNSELYQRVIKLIDASKNDTEKLQKIESILLLLESDENSGNNKMPTAMIKAITQSNRRTRRFNPWDNDDPFRNQSC